MTRHIRHLFLPQISNNNKARALHFSFLSFYLAVFLLVQFSLSALTKLTPGVLGIASDISIERLFTLTNKKREEEGLAPLKVDPNLSMAAQKKAQDMLSNDYWAHNSPQGKTPWDFILSSDYKYIYAGENLAKDFANSDGVVAAWMKSPTHRENITQPKYENVGFAVVNGRLNGEETTLVVQMFGKRGGNEVGQVSQGASISVPQAPQVLSVVSKPKIDIFRLTKILSFALGLFLIGLIILDAVIVFRKKIVRVSGHNIAHVGFLLALITAIFLTSKGMII